MALWGSSGAQRAVFAAREVRADFGVLVDAGEQPAEHLLTQVAVGGLVDQVAGLGRIVAEAGADMLFGPTVGDGWPERRDAVTRTHALANGVYVVTSLVNHPSDIVDPEGRRLATASEPNSIATARVDLDYKQTVAGRMIGPAGGLHPGVYWAERRPDLLADGP